MCWLSVVSWLLLIGGCADGYRGCLAPKAESGSSPNGVVKQEIYVGLFPLDGYLHLKEYHIESEQPPPDEIANQVKRLRRQIEELNYAHSEYGFRLFRSQEESVRHDRGFLTGEYHLTTTERNLKKLVEDSFARVMRRPVDVVIDRKHVSFTFNARGLFVDNQFSDSSSKKGDEVTLAFKNGQTGHEKYEIVFSYKHVPASVPFVEQFGPDVHAERTQSNLPSERD
jgi:hypothetical protein